ncbi:hypothetical protein F4677DRAFT_412708 [Hypoxylon crocopeplum]|nr:hypothetical protein F4677DRAFT_412708 [Hypoxylon crocopeplum]
MAPAPAAQGASTGSTINPHNDNHDSRNEYEEALDGLQPLQPILAGFNHRNRNQHRRAAWWAAFGMLRRHVDKLVGELTESTAALQKPSNSASSKKRKRNDGGTSSSSKDDKRANAKLRDHVRWLRDVLVPKCYLAFSQLTADNQFATLGVVLLGALAQVNAACTRLIGEASPATEDEEGDGKSSVRGLASSSTVAAKESGSSDGRGLPLSREGECQTPDQKGGAVISRDEVARAEKLRRKNAQSEEGAADQSRSTASVLDKSKYQGHDGDSALIGEKRGTASKPSRENTNAPRKEESKPAKKKKAKKGGGDEFDDLFKGLF